MNTGYSQWLMKWRITVTPQDGASGLDVSNLRCVFHAEKKLDETPNYSQITITNMAMSTIARIQPGDRVTVEAGYENGNFGLIFSGDVVQPYVERSEVVDTNLVLVCQDADVFINSAFTAKTLEKGSSNQDVVTACLQGADVSQGTITEKLSKQSSFIRGKVLFGKSSDYLRRAAYTADSQFFIEDGEVNIISAEDYRPGTAVELNPDTGLIGDPSQTDNGVSVKCLLNPSIKLNSLIHVSGDSVKRKMVSKDGDTTPELPADGVYRVVKVTYDGDTHGDDWYCSIEGVSDAIAAENSGASANSGGTVNTYTTAGDGKPKSVLAQIFR